MVDLKQLDSQLFHHLPRERVKRIILSLLLLLTFPCLHAETRYVIDQFKVTLRSGESSSYKILRMLPSGDSLEVLSDNKGSGYSRVRINDGTTGYVLTRQLMKIPSARDRLAIAEKRLEELQDEPQLLSAKFAKLQALHAQLKEQHTVILTEKKDLEQDLAAIRRTAANAIRISNERNELRKQVADFARRVEMLNQQNRELSNSTEQHWFLIGSGVIIVGIIIGLILPQFRLQRRKRSWGSL